MASNPRVAGDDLAPDSGFTVFYVYMGRILPIYTRPLPPPPPNESNDQETPGAMKGVSPNKDRHFNEVLIDCFLVNNRAFSCFLSFGFFTNFFKIKIGIRKKCGG